MDDLNKNEDTQTTPDTTATDTTSTEDTQEGSGADQLRDQMTELSNKEEEESYETDSTETTDNTEGSGDDESNKDETETDTGSTDTTDTSSETTSTDSDDESGKDSGMAKMSFKFRELERKNAELQEQIAKMAETKPEPETQSGPTGLTEEVKTELVVSLMARAQTGELSEGELAKFGNVGTAKSWALQALSDEANPDVLETVLKNAAQGKYGDYSDMMRTVAAEYLPLAYGREHKKLVAELREQKEAASQRDQRQKAYKEELVAIHQKFPQFADKDSESHKYIQTWNSEFIGTLDANGRAKGDGILPKDEAQSLLDHPLKNIATIAGYLERNKTSVTLQQQLEAKEAELAALKRKYELQDVAPETSSSGSPQTGKVTADDLQKRMLDLSNQ